MWVGVEVLGGGWRLRLEMGTEMEEGAVNRKDQNYSGMFDASEMHSPKGYLVISLLLGTLPISHTHPRSMVASPLRKPPPVVTQSSQIQFMTLKHVTKSNVHLSCLQKPVSACWSPPAGLARVVGCDEERKRGGQGCGTPVPCLPL